MQSIRPIGIDLGTTNSVVSYATEVGQALEPETVLVDGGHRTLPSVVYFGPEATYVGRRAMNLLGQAPEYIAQSTKRDIGDPNARFPSATKQFSPVGVASEILGTLAKDASDHLQMNIRDVVITVPADFTNSQRLLTREAAELAGLNVRSLVAEPTAAALAYDLHDEDSLTVLVFDLGGGTFDASIIDIGDSIYDVKATRGDNALGGDDWTECIVESLADSIARDYHVEVPSKKRDPLLYGRLWLAAEKMKHDLGVSNSSRPDSLQYLNVDDVVIPVVESVLSREEFEWRTENLRQRLVQHLDALFQGCGYRHQDIDEVLLVGGSTRLTQVRELVANYFDKAPKRAKNPDEIVANGAAIQAAILAATPALPESSNEFLPEVVKTGDAELSLQRTTLLDSATRSLGFSAHIGKSEELEYVEVIRNNTSIPVEEWKDGFQPFKPDSGEVGASSVSFDIYETNETDPTPDFREKRHMGKIRIRNLNPSIPIEKQQLEISFKIDADNLLHVHAIEETTGNEAQGTFEPNLGISVGELEQESKALPRVYEQ